MENRVLSSSIYIISPNFPIRSMPGRRVFLIQLNFSVFNVEYTRMYYFINFITCTVYIRRIHSESKTIHCSSEL